MSENELLEFNQNVLNEINAEADIQKEIPEAVFFHKFIKVLNESSDPQDFDEYLQIISDQENFKVDGYYLEKNSKEKFTGVLHLFVTDFEQDKNKLQETLNLSDVNKIFKKTKRFLKIINKKSSILDWEESSPQFKLGIMLHDYLEQLLC